MPPIDLANPFAVFIPLLGVFGLVLWGALLRIVWVDRKLTREQYLARRRASRYKPEGRWWGLLAGGGLILMLGSLGYVLVYTIQHGIA